VVELTICREGGKQKVQEITVEPEVHIETFVGKHCKVPYEDSVSVIDGSCICFHAWIDKDNEGLLLDYRRVEILQDDHEDSAIVIYDPEGLHPPVVDRGFVDKTEPGPGQGPELFWQQIAKIDDGDRCWAVVLYYRINFDTESDGGRRRLMSVRNVTIPLTVSTGNRGLLSTDLIATAPLIHGRTRQGAWMSCDVGEIFVWDECADDKKSGKKGGKKGGDGGAWNDGMGDDNDMSTTTEGTATDTESGADANVVTWSNEDDAWTDADSKFDGTRRKCADGSRRSGRCMAPSRHGWREFAKFIFVALFIAVIACMCIGCLHGREFVSGPVGQSSAVAVSRSTVIGGQTGGDALALASARNRVGVGHV
jgi:hypothetical protein